MSKPRVFVGSSIEGLAAARAVQKNLERDATVTIWNQGHFSAGAPTLESLLSVLDSTDFAVLLVTPDNAGGSREAARARDNVVFETGLFMGRLGASRTFLLMEEDPSVRLPTDLSGVTVARFDRRQSETNLESALAPACELIRKAIQTRLPDPKASPDNLTCFISYNAEDARFAERLYRDLQEVGVRCWLDSKELKIGDRWQVEIDRALASHDKVVLVLSEASVASAWVRREVEVALDREAKTNRTILLPLRIDEAAMNADDEHVRRLVNTRQISDFSKWEGAEEYRRAFSRLARDLTVIAATETESQSNA